MKRQYASISAVETGLQCLSATLSSAIVRLGRDLVRAVESTFVFDGIKRNVDHWIRTMELPSFLQNRGYRSTGGQQAVPLQQAITDIWLLLARALHSLSCALVSRGLFSEFLVASRQDFRRSRHVFFTDLMK
jgi:hypothetical protein